jgi:hypothetical protein
MLASPARNAPHAARAALASPGTQGSQAVGIIDSVLGGRNRTLTVITLAGKERTH